MPENSRRDGLQDLANLATLANYFQLRSVERQTEEMKEILAQQQRQVQYQSYLKQFLFEMHQFLDKKLQDIADDVVSIMAVDKYLRRAKNENISSESFDSIPDKVYFEGAFALLQKERDRRAEFEAEAKEVEDDYRAFFSVNNLQSQFTANCTNYRKATSGFHWAICIVVTVVAITILFGLSDYASICGGLSLLLLFMSNQRRINVRKKTKETIYTLKQYADGLEDGASTREIESAFAKLIRHYSKRVETHRIKHPTLSLLDSV